MLDGLIVLVATVLVVGWCRWLGNRDQRRREAELDRRIEQRYRHG